MAKEPAAKAPEKSGVNITYVPKDGDPSEVVWNRHRFRANVPTLVRDEAMIALAKGNRWFTVEGHEQAAPADAPGKPKTAEEYRAHAVKWFKEAQTADEMQARWDAEAGLREECGVGTDDLEWLATIFDPKMAQLKAADQA